VPFPLIVDPDTYIIEYISAVLAISSLANNQDLVLLQQWAELEFLYNKNKNIRSELSRMFNKEFSHFPVPDFPTTIEDIYNYPFINKFSTYFDNLIGNFHSNGIFLPVPQCKLSSVQVLVKMLETQHGVFKGSYAILGRSRLFPLNTTGNIRSFPSLLKDTKLNILALRISLECMLTSVYKFEVINSNLQFDTTTIEGYLDSFKKALAQPVLLSPNHIRVLLNSISKEPRAFQLGVWKGLSAKTSLYSKSMPKFKAYFPKLVRIKNLSLYH
jgi:hypothetical protein